MAAAKESVDCMLFAPDRDGAAREFPSIENVIEVRTRYSYEREASAKFGRLRRGLEVSTSLAAAVCFRSRRPAGL